MQKAVHTIVVLIVNAFNAAAGVRVEEEDYWWWYWGGMVVVFEAKRSSGAVDWKWPLAKARFRFDSAVCGLRYV
jgi:hypothetical protein